MLASLVGAGLLLPFGSARAGIDEHSVAYTFNFFSDVDGFNVYTHYGSSGLKLQNDLALNVQWVHDVVVFPAIESAPGSQEAIDAITTASRPISALSDPFSDFVKTRDSVEGFLSFAGANAGYYVSTESDYFAQMVSGSYNRDLWNDNLNLAAGLSYSWDSIEPLEDADTPGIADYRRTWHGNVVATQVVTPTTVFRLGVEANRVTGLQHDPYRNVYVAGTNVAEKHPNYRLRQDVFMNVSQYITNLSSLKFDYRYYTDDWGVSSHTFGIKLNQYVTDALIVRYRYRYYTQLAADFYSDDYLVPGGIGGYQTNDYRLGEFGAHLFGGRILWSPYLMTGKLAFLDRAHIIFNYEHYFNSNNFSANIFETGLQIAY